MKKKVYICAPISGDLKDNIKKVKQYTKFALECDVVPVAPHYYAMCIDVKGREEKDKITSVGLSLLTKSFASPFLIIN